MKVKFIEDQMLKKFIFRRKSWTEILILQLNLIFKLKVIVGAKHYG